MALSSDTIIRIRFDGISGDSNAGSITGSRARFGFELGEVTGWGDSVQQLITAAGPGSRALLGEMSKAVGR